MGYIVLAIVVLVVLAGVVLLTAMRRNDANRAIGELSRETKKRDRELATVAAGAPVSGRDVERAAVLERRGGVDRSRAVGDRGAAGRVRAARRRDTRDHPPSVLQPLDRHHDDGVARCVRRLRAWRSCGRPSSAAASAARSRSAASPTSSPTSRPPAASSTSPKAACGSPSTRRAHSRRRAKIYSRARARRYGARRRRALPEVPAPRLPCAELQHLAVVRVPVPRLAVQPCR